MALWSELVLEEQENLGSISGLSKWVSHPRHKVVVKKTENLPIQKCLVSVHSDKNNKKLC